MEQKRVLWIVAAVGLFLLVVIGTALWISSPSSKMQPALNTLQNSGTQFEDPNAYWITVHDNIWDDENWAVYDGVPY